MKKICFGLLFIIFFCCVHFIYGQSGGNVQSKLIGKWINIDNKSIFFEFTQTEFINNQGVVREYIIENGAIILILKIDPPIIDGVIITEYSGTITIADSFEFIDDNTLKMIGGSSFRIYRRLE
jgi:hypothetical protein